MNQNAGQIVYTIPANLNAPPSGVAGHIRGTVSTSVTTATTAFGAVPTGAIAVTCQVESADSANVVYVTFDGTSTPSATLGFVVPVAPGTIRIPFKTGLIDGTKLKFIAVGGTAHVQGYFEFP